MPTVRSGQSTSGSGIPTGCSSQPKSPRPPGAVSSAASPALARARTYAAGCVDASVSGGRAPAMPKARRASSWRSRRALDVVRASERAVRASVSVSASGSAPASARAAHASSATCAVMSHEPSGTGAVSRPARKPVSVPNRGVRPGCARSRRRPRAPGRARRPRPPRPRPWGARSRPAVPARWSAATTGRAIPPPHRLRAPRAVRSRPAVRAPAAVRPSSPPRRCPPVRCPATRWRTAAR